MKLLTGGMMRIGWATPSFQAGKLLGSDRHSYAFDGHLVSGVVGYWRREKWCVADPFLVSPLFYVVSEVAQ